MDQQLLKSCFESSGPSLESTYSSGPFLRRSSSTPGAAFPLPPLHDKQSGASSVHGPQRSLTDRKLLVLNDFDSDAIADSKSVGPDRRETRLRHAVCTPRDAPTGHNWNPIGSTYVFPKPSPLESHELDLPESPRETRANSAPPLTSALLQPAPLHTDPSAPAVLSAGKSASGMPLLVQRMGDVPAAPRSPDRRISPDDEHALPPRAAEPTSTSAGQQIRPKASIHQRLRSIFSTQHVRQKSTASAPSRVEKAQPPSPEVEPRARRPRPPPLAIRWTFAEPVAEADNEDERSPSSTHSAHSSLLKRSDAYASFERALAGKPPVSPVSRTFAATLDKGATGSGNNVVKNRRRERDQPTFQVYEAPDEANECTATPRASALNKKVLSPKGSMPAEEVDAKRWRLLRKASSHVVGRVRQTVGSRPTSLVLPSRTDVTARPAARRPASDLPAVSIELASPAEYCAETRSIPGASLREPQPGHPWRSSTSTLSEAGDRAGSRWRRSSLSIQVPSIDRLQPEGSSSAFSPAFDLCTPTSTSHSQATTFDGLLGRVDVKQEGEPSGSLQTTETENRLLRLSLQDKEAELELLRARERSLADCLRTGNDMVRELSEERDELEERLRRISWYSCGGDPAWLSSGGKSRGARDRRSATSAHSSPEAKCVGTFTRSPSDDEPCA